MSETATRQAMSETTDGMPHSEASKKRRTRRASNYIVLRRIEAGELTDGETPTDRYEIVARNGTIKGCVKRITDDQITGELTIVCVRRRPFVSSTQEEMVFKNV